LSFDRSWNWFDPSRDL